MKRGYSLHGLRLKQKSPTRPQTGHQRRSPMVAASESNYQMTDYAKDFE